MRPSKIPTLAGVFLLVVGVAAGVVLVNREQIFRLGASPQTTPRNIKVSNIENTSLTISWTTDSKTAGFLKWGETANLGQTQQSELQLAKGSVHSVNLNGLIGGRTYYFKINSDGTDYDNSGSLWTATTTPSQSQLGLRVTGTVQLQDGSNVENAIVYVTNQQGSIRSSTTSQSGAYTLVTTSQTDEPIDVLVQAGDRGIATAQARSSKANPLPVMVLGKTYDFRTNEVSSQNQNPESSVTLPTQQNTSSRLNTNQAESTVGVISITSIKEGETISSGKPEISGTAPKNTKIDIVINSVNQTKASTTSNASGSWKYSPSQTLTDGNHTITASFVDTRGITRSIVRKFVVVANAKQPAFVSSPSASLVPTQTPAPTKSPVPSVAPTTTPSPTPIATKSPSPSPSPTIVASVSPSPTSRGELPNAGSREFTFAVLVMGLLLLTGGVLLAKK